MHKKNITEQIGLSPSELWVNYMVCVVFSCEFVELWLGDSSELSMSEVLCFPEPHCDAAAVFIIIQTNGSCYIIAYPHVVT